jgi:hypothetical protein
MRQPEPGWLLGKINALGLDVVDIVIVEKSQVRRPRGAGREGYGGIRHGELRGSNSSRLWSCASFKGHRDGPRDVDEFIQSYNPAVSHDDELAEGPCAAEPGSIEVLLTAGGGASTATDWPMSYIHETSSRNTASPTNR